MQNGQKSRKPCPNPLLPILCAEFDEIELMRLIEKRYAKPRVSLTRRVKAPRSSG
jgi:hypothetical protein